MPFASIQKPSECNCAECPLRHSPFVPNEPPPSGRLPTFVVMGEEPGPKEVPTGRPFVGPSGQLLDKFLRRASLKRTDGLIMNALPCRAGRFLNQGEVDKALDCCAPYRNKLLATALGKPVLALGGRAVSTLTDRDGILKWYGFPRAPLPGIPTGDVLPAMHPAFVLRDDGYSIELWRCVERFGDMVRGKWAPPYWEEPPLIIDGDYARALDALDDELLAFDVETGGLDAQYDELLCVSVSDGVSAVCFPWPPPDPETEAAFRRLYEMPGVRCGHNFQHDQLSLAAHGYHLHPGARVVDTLNLHAAAYPRLPHRLAIAAARYRMPRHKAEFKVDEGNVKGGAAFVQAAAVRPGELRKYCALDSWTTAKLARDLVYDLAGNPNGEATFEELTAMSAIALGMRRKGLRVNEKRREEHLIGYAVDEALDRMQFGTMFPDVNLGANGSTNAVRSLFFKTLGAMTLEKTKAGKPKMDAWTLQRWAAGIGVTDPRTPQAAKLLLLIRRAAHMTKMIEGLPVSPDGRVHPPWNSWGALTGRWSCSKPNLMNLPKVIRDLFLADEGCTFVVADMDKVELRVIAILANDTVLLQAFERGVDVHQANAIDLFGSKANKAQRDLAKRLVYGFNYGAKPETVWKALVTQFPKLSLAVITSLHARWFETHPAIKAWHGKVLMEARRKGRVVAPIGTRQTFFFEGGVDPSKVYNFPAQSAVAKVVNDAMARLTAAGWDIRIQCHDELVLNVPNAQVPAGVKALTDALETPVILAGQTWVLPVDSRVGPAWGILAPFHKDQEAKPWTPSKRSSSSCSPPVALDGSRLLASTLPSPTWAPASEPRSMWTTALVGHTSSRRGTYAK